MEEDYCLWGDVFGLRCGGYNSQITLDLYNVALKIKEAREAEDVTHTEEIAGALGLARDYVELMQYLLASAHYPDTKWTDSPFEYGTSPRCLFVGDKSNCDKLIADLKAELTGYGVEV